jgi:hypothetical protein
MRLLLLIPTHSYRVNDFMDAARAQGVEVIVGSEKRQSLEGFSKGGTFVVDFRDFETGLRQIIEHTDEHPVQAVIGVDETTVHLAALASQALGLKGNAPDAVSKAVDKSEFRRALAKTGLPVPDFKLISADTAAKAAAANLPYPCVLKPLGLSASRGVIRADDADQAENAIARRRWRGRARQGHPCRSLHCRRRIRLGRHFAGWPTDGAGVVRQTRSVGWPLFRRNHLCHAIPPQRGATVGYPAGG